MAQHKWNLAVCHSSSNSCLLQKLPSNFKDLHVKLRIFPSDQASDFAWCLPVHMKSEIITQSLHVGEKSLAWHNVTSQTPDFARRNVPPVQALQVL